MKCYLFSRGPLFGCMFTKKSYKRRFKNKRNKLSADIKNVEHFYFRYQSDTTVTYKIDASIIIKPFSINFRPMIFRFSDVSDKNDRIIYHLVVVRTFCKFGLCVIFTPLANRYDVLKFWTNASTQVEYFSTNFHPNLLLLHAPY